MLNSTAGRTCVPCTYFQASRHLLLLTWLASAANGPLTFSLKTAALDAAVSVMRRAEWACVALPAGTPLTVIEGVDR